MPRWMKPTKEMPLPECGDRVLIIVMERPRTGTPIVPRLVILEAIEGGWDSPDPVYSGYTPEDGELWSWERDVCQVVHVLDIACLNCGGSGGGLEPWLECPHCRGTGRA